MEVGAVVFAAAAGAGVDLVVVADEVLEGGGTEVGAFVAVAVAVALEVDAGVEVGASSFFSA